MTPVAAAKKLSKFDPRTFLSTINGGRKIAAFLKKQTIFAQGDPSDAVFYIKEGKVKLTIVSKAGKEATIGVLNTVSYTHLDVYKRQGPINALGPVKRSEWLLSHQRRAAT